MRALGFRKLETLEAPNLYIYARLANRASKDLNQHSL